MSETIKGLVTNIVDGNTFEMKVQQRNGQPLMEPEAIEQVQIAGYAKPSPNTLSGILAKLDLEKKICGQTVECEIIDRDGYNRVIVRMPENHLRSLLL